MITLYGRKTVLEILKDRDVDVHCLHVADSNRQSGVFKEILDEARRRNIPTKSHDRSALSRISRNQRQDQGVAIDLTAPKYQPLDTLTEAAGEWLFLDRITNPQNLGMILRSVAGAPINGVVLPRAGGAKIDPLVYKSSAGCVLHADIRMADEPVAAVRYLKQLGFEVIAMTGTGAITIGQLTDSVPRVFVLGNETDGISDELLQECDKKVNIPLNAAVESLNVSVVASLIAYRSVL